jgi:5,10-methylenetetrahydromethanopterin reductase
MSQNVIRGIGFGTGYQPGADVRSMSSAVADAEQAGFDLCFFSETFYTHRDSVTALAAFALATGSATLGATQVVRLRSPLVTAQTIATLDELSGGRVLIALGSATDKHAARNGLPPQRPPQALREHFTAVRMLLTGEKVTYHGEFVRLDGVGLGFTPIRPRVPIWVAGSSRLGLRIAGELGDGVLLDAGTSAEYSAAATGHVHAAREAAGRTDEPFTIAQLVNTSLEADRATALDRVRWEVATKFRSPGTGRGKIAVGETAIPADAPERISAIFAEHGEAALLDAVDDDMVSALSAAGTADDVVARIGEYRAAGVDLPIVRAAADGQIGGLLEIAPRLRGAERP